MATHAEVAHNWAHQTGTHTTGSRMFYEGRCLYSHGRHFMLGYIDPIHDIAFIADDNVSVSTRQHQSHARSAVNGLYPMLIELPEETISRLAFWGPEPRHFDMYCQTINNGFDTIAREMIRKINGMRPSQKKARAIISYQNHIHTWNEFARYLSLRFPTVDPWPFDLFSTEYAECPNPYRWTPPKTAGRQKSREEKLADFRAGKRSTIHGNPTYLRLMPSNHGKVQTSQGVTFPTTDARRAWPIIRRMMRNGPIVPEYPITFGGFQLDGVYQDELIAGCHHIPIEEVERFAAELELI